MAQLTCRQHRVFERVREPMHEHHDFLARRAAEPTLELRLECTLRRFVRSNDGGRSRKTCRRALDFVGNVGKASELGRVPQLQVNGDVALGGQALRDERVPTDALTELDDRRPECEMPRATGSIGLRVFGIGRTDAIGYVKQIERRRAPVGVDNSEQRPCTLPDVQRRRRHHRIGRAARLNKGGENRCRSDAQVPRPLGDSVSRCH